MRWWDPLSFLTPVFAWLIEQVSVRRRQRIVVDRERSIGRRERDLGDLLHVREQHAQRMADLIVPEIADIQPRLGRPDVSIRVRWNNFSLIPLELEYTETTVTLMLGSSTLLAEKHQRTHNKQIPASWHEQTDDAIPLYANIVEGMRDEFKDRAGERQWTISCTATFRRPDTGERLMKSFEQKRGVPNSHVVL